MKNVGKYKEIILYIVFGILTTVINIGIYQFLFSVVKLSNIYSNGIALIVSILFAYFTNKLYVFESKAISMKVILSEMAKFFGSRIFTGMIDMVFMFITVDLLSLSAIFMKILSNVVVIVLNYIFSKLFVFAKEKK